MKGNLPPKDAFAYFRIVETQITGIGALVQQIAQENVLRVEIAICNGTGTVLSFSTQGNALAGQGFITNANSPNLLFTQQIDGSLAQSAWYAINLGANKITVVEVFVDNWPSANDPNAPTRQTVSVSPEADDCNDG